MDRLPTISEKKVSFFEDDDLKNVRNTIEIEEKELKDLELITQLKREDGGDGSDVFKMLLGQRGDRFAEEQKDKAEFNTLKSLFRKLQSTP